MKHQLQPNTYTICESTEQCKELFECAKANSFIPIFDGYRDGEIILYIDDKGEITSCIEPFDIEYEFDDFKQIPLPEFIARLKGEWVEGKTVTLSEEQWHNVFSCLDCHDNNDMKAILANIYEQLNNQ